MTELKEEKILHWKKELDNCRIEKSKLEGQKEELIRNLKEKFEISTIEEIEGKIENLKKIIEELKISSDKDIEEYEKNYAL